MEGRRFDHLTRRWRDVGGSRRSLLRLAGVFALPGLHALGSPPALAAAVADAHCPPGNASFGGRRFAQTFVAQHASVLTQATIEAVFPSAANTDDYLIEIRKTTRRGKPSATVLAFAHVDNIVKPPSGQTTTVTANFNPGAPVKKAKRYALAITGVGGITASVQANLTSGCAGSLFEDGDLDDTFVKIPGGSIVFATLVTKA